MKNYLHRAICLIALALSIALSLPALAQTITVIPKPPIRANPDERGVDLARGTVEISDPQLSIGTKENGISFVRYWAQGYWRHNYRLLATYESQFQGTQIFKSVSIQVGNVTYYFDRVTASSSAPWFSRETNGNTLTETASNFTFTDRDGNSIFFDKSGITLSVDYWGPADALGTVITHTNGLKEYLTYSSIPGHRRLQSVRTSTGFQFKFTYASNTSASASDWARMIKVQAINNALDYCDPAADSCATPNQAPAQVTYNLTPTGGTTWSEAVTDPENRTRTYLGSGFLLLSMRRPSATTSGTDSVTYSWVQPGGINAPVYVSSVAVAGVGTWGYNFVAGSGTLTASVSTPTLPPGSERVVVSDSTKLEPTSVKDENGQTTLYEYCPSGTPNCSPGLLTKKTLPEGNYTTYAYDARGNLTSATATPKSGSGLATVSTSATYPGNCPGYPVTAATMNKPVTTTDAAGNVTTYCYNSDGSLDFVRAPTPSAGAAQPETHFTYWTGQAWLKWYSNSVDLAPDPITWLANTTTCVSGSWPCSSANQRITEVGYYGGPTATNMLVSGYTTRSGDNSASSSVGYGYDAAGNVTTKTDGVGQVSTIGYNAARQQLYVNTPSVDGGSGYRRTNLLHYDGNGQVDSQTWATTNPDGSNFTPLLYRFPEYDGAGRQVAEREATGAGSIYAIKQWSYNGRNLVDCETLRMNPADFGSRPDACSQATGGQDRITHYIWEFAGALDRAQSGYPNASTGVQRDEVHYTRTLNGQLRTMTDAKGNITSYAYDGHDRMVRECYNADAPACQDGSAPDFVQFTYDGAGRLTNRGLRGHSTAITIGYVYDNLGRVTNANYPGGGFYDSPVSYTYDNLGELLSANDNNTHSVTFGYDPIGRMTSEGDSVSTRTMQYDAAGRRTRLTWPDSRYITYQYNAVGQMTNILESGSSSLASFTYDGLGNRTSLTRGNGVVTTYEYDAVARLSCLTHDLASGGTPSCSSSSVTASGQDQATNFTYNTAGQITGRTSANDAYAFKEYINVNRGYSVNALNQYTASGSVFPTYDEKANLASAGGSAAYAYSTKNELVLRSDTGIGFYHNPLGQLDGVIGAGYGFSYVGNDIIEERADSSPFPILRRYVYGPRDDEPIVWYEGSDFSDKRYLVADERGSIVAVTDGSGAAIAINSYDEYGIPGAGNAGRFQYTGQAWIPQLNMYSFKARIYSPTLGRFLQTDPAGYPDGPNWYNYAISDPINRRDPSGRQIVDNIVTAQELQLSAADPSTAQATMDAWHSGDRIGLEITAGVLAPEIAAEFAPEIVVTGNYQLMRLLQGAGDWFGTGLNSLMRLAGYGGRGAKDAEATVSLFRALGEKEAQSFATDFGYSSGANSSGKYFAFNLEGEESAMNFATHPFNSHLGNTTITQVDVPESFLLNGTRFNDPGGAGASIHFGDEFLNQINDFGPKVIGQ